MKTARLITRMLLLAAALFFAIGGPLPIWMERIVPALSPLVLVAESIAQRSWYAGLFWGLPSLAMLALAVWKGRFFCQWLCPLGTIYALPQKLSLKKKVLPVRLNALIFWVVISASAIGLPALLFLDPLSTFSRIGAGLGRRRSQASRCRPSPALPLMRRRTWPSAALMVSTAAGFCSRSSARRASQDGMTGSWPALTASFSWAWRCSFFVLGSVFTW